LREVGAPIPIDLEKPYISKVEIANFRNFEKIEFPLHPTKYQNSKIETARSHIGKNPISFPQAIRWRL
jgi:hypothetical protein